MRRLSAFLMIAALVAVLVPSATLAGKPVTAITSVRVLAGGGAAPDCSATWWVHFSGRAYEARVTPVVGGVSLDPMTFAVDNRSGAGGFYGPIVDLATRVYTWKAELLDRKGNVLGYAVTTLAEKWTDETLCPTTGYYVGYPEWAYPNPLGDLN